MLAIVLETIDDSRNISAKQAQVQRKNGAYQQKMDIYSHMDPHVREVPHRPVFVNICVTPMSATVEAVFGIIFEEACNR